MRTKTPLYSLNLTSKNARIVAMTSSGTNPAQARAASPSNSFYALSDDEEGDYNTITHTTTGRGVKLLYSKSKVDRPFHLSAGGVALWSRYLLLLQ